MPGTCCKRVFLYQSLHAPVLPRDLTPEVVRIDKYLQPLSEPVRGPNGQFASVCRAQMPVHQQPAASFLAEAEPFGETVYAPEWLQGWSIPPVLAKLALRPALQWPQFLGQPPPTVAPPADSWLYSFSEPVRKRPALPVGEQQALAFTPARPFDEYPVDRWLLPLAEPVRVKAKLLPAAQTALASPAATIAPAPPAWGGFIDGPTFKYRMQYQAEAWNPFTPPPPNIRVDDEWPMPLAYMIPWTTAPVPLQFGVQEVLSAEAILPFVDPVRVRPGLGPHYQVAQPYFETQQFPETVTLDRWMMPFSQPVRQVRALPVAARQVLVQVPAVTFFLNLVNPAAWWQDFARPLPQPKQWSRGMVQTVAYAKSDTFTETITVDKWFAPYTDPVNSVIKSVPVVLGVPMEPEGAVTVDKWFNHLSVPVRLPPAFRKGTHQTEAFAPFEFAERIRLDKWMQPLSLPPSLVKRGLAAWLQQPTADIANTSIPSITYLPLSEPVRQPKQWARGMPHTLAYGKSDTFNELVTLDRWLRPFGEPVRQPIGMRAQYQAAQTWVPEFVTVDKWFVPLSEPKRFKPAMPPRAQLASALQLTATQFREIVSIDRWLQPLSLPPSLVRRRLLAGSNQTTAFVKAAPFGEQLLVDKWFRHWSEPRRSPRLLLPASQVFQSRYPDRPAGVLGFLVAVEGPADTAVLTTVMRITTPNPAAGANIVVSEIDPTTPSPVSVAEQ